MRPLPAWLSQVLTIAAAAGSAYLGIRVELASLIERVEGHRGAIVEIRADVRELRATLASGSKADQGVR